TGFAHVDNGFESSRNLSQFFRRDGTNGIRFTAFVNPSLNPSLQETERLIISDSRQTGYHFFLPAGIGNQQNGLVNIGDQSPNPGSEASVDANVDGVGNEALRELPW